MLRYSKLPVAAAVVATTALSLLAPVAVRAEGPDRGAALGTANAKLLELRTADARAAIAPLEGTAASDPEVAVALARVLEQEKKYGDAAAKLRSAAGAAPADPLPQLWLGEVLLRDNKGGDANAAFGKAVDLAKARLAKGEDAQAFYALGAAQMRLKQYDAALGNLEKAAQLDGGNPLPLLAMGITLAYKNDWNGSYSRLTQAIERNSGLAYGYFYRGMAAEKLKKKDQLINDLERFVAMAPDAPEAGRAKAIVAAARR